MENEEWGISPHEQELKALSPPAVRDRQCLRGRVAGSEEEGTAHLQYTPLYGFLWNYKSFSSRCLNKHIFTFSPRTGTRHST